jgi:hypothetical protein
MIDDTHVMPRIPLGVLVDAGTDSAAGIAIGKKYRSGTGLLPATDERFALQVLAVGGADVAATVAQHPEWCGILLGDELRGSHLPADTGWAAALNIDDALLPLEFIEHLRDERASESFVARVLTCHAWRDLHGAGISLAALQGFFARHKYLLMRRSTISRGRRSPRSWPRCAGPPVAAVTAMRSHTCAATSNIG